MENIGYHKEYAYNPNQLLDTLAAQLQVASDTALARKLNVTKSVIKKIRCHVVPVGGSLLLRMNDVSAIKVEELRRLMGDRRHRLRVGAAPRWHFKREAVRVDEINDHSTA